MCRWWKEFLQRVVVELLTVLEPAQPPLDKLFRYTVTTSWLMHIFCAYGVEYDGYVATYLAII